MRSNRRAGFALLCVLTALACSSEARPKAEPAPLSPEAADQPAAAPADPGAAEGPAAEVEPTPKELPVREDFDDEAEQQITAENFRAELDKLEKELAEAP